MRTSVRRFTRLTDAFSKKAGNHATALALCFIRARTREVDANAAPAAGIADPVWSMSEIVALADSN